MPWPFARNSQVVVASPDDVIASADTRFAFRLFHELAQSTNGNVFFSPAGVMLCLAMVHDAAAGTTRAEMASALEIAGLGPTEQELVIKGLIAAFRERDEVEICSSNSLWCDLSAQVLPEYAATVRELFQAALTPLDFHAPDAVNTVNGWVQEKTRGKISRIVETLPALTALIAANAVYLKGQWTSPFPAEFTYKSSFTTADGQIKQVPIMNQFGSFSYYEGQDLQAAVLPYKGEIAMHVVLPSPNQDAGDFAGAWNVQK